MLGFRDGQTSVIIRRSLDLTPGEERESSSLPSFVSPLIKKKKKKEKGTSVFLFMHFCLPFSHGKNLWFDHSRKKREDNEKSAFSKELPLLPTPFLSLFFFSYKVFPGSDFVAMVSIKQCPSLICALFPVRGTTFLFTSFRSYCLYFSVRN